MAYWVYGSGLQGRVEDGDISIQVALKLWTGQEPTEKA